MNIFLFPIKLNVLPSHILTCIGSYIYCQMIIYLYNLKQNLWKIHRCPCMLIGPSVGVALIWIESTLMPLANVHSSKFQTIRGIKPSLHQYCSCLCINRSFTVSRHFEAWCNGTWSWCTSFGSMVPQILK